MFIPGGPRKIPPVNTAVAAAILFSSLLSFLLGIVVGYVITVTYLFPESISILPPLLQEIVSLLPTP